MASTTPFHLLETVLEIERPDQQIVAEHSAAHEDTLFSFGKKEWAQIFRDPYEGEGIFKTLELIHFNQELFGLVQGYEHTRQTKPVLTTLDPLGKALWSKEFSGPQLQNMALSQQKLAMINEIPPEDQRRKAASYTGTCLELYDLRNGKILLTHEIHLPPEFRLNDRLREFILKNDIFPYSVVLVEKGELRNPNKLETFLEVQLNAYGAQFQKDLGKWSVSLAAWLESR